MDYKTSGVDIEAGYRSVELMKKYVKEKAEDFFRRYDTKNRNCTGTSK